ncbi:MAG TPA: carboxylating nicotinate-nucleotide diphosphorylase [Bacteroidales bacterium]|nr:carboxylating nicotinate-nucleotide diphosphorylase [Bacteroidales bacterium]
MTPQTINDLIDRALSEDIGDGDHSSLSCIPHGATGKARLLIKDNGILAGVNIARLVYKRIDPEISLNILIEDGQNVKPGDIGFEVEGSSRNLLQAERLVLNFLQRMSGIATETMRYVDALRNYNTRILDTRKTTPGLRLIEKEAVRFGGGTNHRMGLYDMIMLKDNHIDFAGGIPEAISRAREYLIKEGRDLKIEIEARSLEEVNTIISHGGVDRIMLDNFSVEETREAVKIIAGRFETESSGGITLETLQEYAACGVDYISVGALTHHIRSLDMSLKVYE